MRTLRTTLFWLLAAALLACHGVVAWQSVVVNHLWEDEAFNLTVPLNLLSGLGYASDGTLSGSSITPFDPRISTGPTVLLPVAAVLALGADTVMGARLVPLAFWMLLLAGAGVLGHRLGGRWAALLAAAVPLAFNTTAGVSPIQGPADLLGEIPAAALLVWALIVLPRRAWLAGLLVGLAVQAKLIALLALPAFAVALWMLAPGTGWMRVRTTLRRSWLPLVMVALPTLLVELAALVGMGFSGYLRHLRSLGGFLLSGGQDTAPTTIAQKATTFADAWFVWPWAAAVAGLLTVALVVAGAVAHRRTSVAGSAESGRGEPGPAQSPRAESPRAESLRGRTAIVLAAGVGLATYLAWWSLAAHLPLWVRHPAPGVFAFTPILAAAAAGVAAAWWRRRRTAGGASDAGRGSDAGTGSSILRAGIGAVGAGVIVVVVAAGAALHAVSALAPPAETLQSQRAGLEPLRAWVAETGTDWLAAEPWGRPVAAVVLTGAHVGLWDAPGMADVPRLTPQPCVGETLAQAGEYRICSAPEE
ncbi:hypothetical protein GCM10025768_07290 [Microbacterium pseudoresistens]|uniref:DUF2029 domain-containing protein n=1 Tax=Microbacterium pseudoresistens TaxID=640634 RepID=A0A7Y9EV84_9MICO|nr:hypothetical protein [Microbacterium pseudoresistens]NYD54567.1 hypothetical protein [Microbacterium pseudoresistens]